MNTLMYDTKNEKLTVITDKGTLIVAVEGDCCSRSVETCDIPTDVVGAKVVSVDEPSVATPPGVDEWVRK